jgi:hypothetical protein
MLATSTVEASELVWFVGLSDIKEFPSNPWMVDFRSNTQTIIKMTATVATPIHKIFSRVW